MLWNTSRWLTYFTAVLYASPGIFLFFWVEQLARLFAWFMTIMIGGWTLGTAWLASIAARRGQWSLAFYLTRTLAVVPYLWDKNLNIFIFRKPGMRTAT